METYQDITVISRYLFSKSEAADTKENDKNSLGFLSEVHQVAVDSMHASTKSNEIYHDIIEERANSLLFQE
jgi:hypothetical protein